MRSNKVLEAQTWAALAAALHRREELQHQWAVASYTSSGSSSPESLDVELAAVDALILELEEALAPAPAPSAPPEVDLSAPPANDAQAPSPALPEYLSTKQAAALLGVSVKHLEGLRTRGKGPPFIRIGHAVRYATADLRPRK